MKKLILSLGVLSLLTIISCHNKSKKNETSADSMATLSETNIPPGSKEQSSSAHEIPVESFQLLLDSAPGHRIPKLAPQVDWDKKIIKTASLTLEVPDFKKYSEQVYRTVRQLGGYIAQEDQSLSEEKNETVITIKVPVVQFETMMNELPATGTKLIERKINTDDVSSKIVDTKSRLQAKKEMRLKYLEFLRQSKNMKEVLEVQKEVNDIQEEIEAASGQGNYLSHQAALSTINLTFFQVMATHKPDAVHDPSFFTRVLNAFRSGVLWMAELFIGLMYIWPLVLLIIAGIFIWKKSGSQKKAISATVSSSKK